jgi:ubiquinone/menaquinone biosynthesis C-methylase UbiE
MNSSLPASTEKSQHDNKSWWTHNPMTYDWEGKIHAKPGTPEFYEESDQRALEAHRPFGHPQFPKEPPYAQLIPWEKVRDQRVLEIGCGMGLHASLFAKAGAKITTMDLTTTASRLARRRFQLQNVPASVIQSDGEKLPFSSNSFDQVWSWGVIHHSSDTPAIVREILRILKPGGTFRAMVYHRSSVRYWLIGGIQHGLVRGKLLKMSLAEVNQTFTDGAIARHYTKHELPILLDGFKNIRSKILQEAGSDALPKISPVLQRIAPQFASSFDQWINDHFGWFLFFEAQKPS